MLDANPYAAPSAPSAAPGDAAAADGGAVRLTYVVGDEQNVRIRALVRRAAWRRPLGIAIAAGRWALPIAAAAIVGSSDRRYGPLPAIVLVCALVGGMRLVAAALRRERIRSAPSHGREVDAVLDDSAVAITTPLVQVRARWEAFSRALIGRDGILLYQTIVGYWLPYDGLRERAEAADLIALIRRHVKLVRDLR